MSAVSHDFKRALTQRPIVVLFLIMLILPVLGTYSSMAPYSQNSAGVSYYSRGFGIGSNGSYNITTMVYTGPGNPVQNDEVNITSGNTVYHGNTDSLGYANFTLKNLNASEISYLSPNEKPKLSYSYTTQYGTINKTLFLYKAGSGAYQFNYSGFYPASGSGESTLNSTVSRYSVTTLSKGGSLVNPQVNLFYEGRSGSSSPLVYLYYEPINNSVLFGGNSPSTSSIKKENMTLFGEYSGFTSKSINPTNVSITSPFYLFALFSPKGQLLGYVMFSVQSPAAANLATETFYGNTAEIYELFIPIIALLSAYYLFGKDRIEGVLDSVLIRPLNRTSLVLIRYFSGTSAILGASLVSFSISSIVIYSSYGRLLPVNTDMTVIWTIVAETLSFSGIMFLLSTFIKSQGKLISALVGVFMITDLFWSFRPLFPPLIMALIPGIHAGSFAYSKLIILLYYLSPSGLSAISEGLNLGAYTIQGVSVSTVQGITQASYGLTSFNMVLSGLIWILVPTILAVIKFKKWD